jgi:hypothetical protein
MAVVVCVVPSPNISALSEPTSHKLTIENPPNKTALAMIFKLAQAAEKTWRRLDGHNQLPKVILGVTFTDGIEVVRSQAAAA